MQRNEPKNITTNNKNADERVTAWCTTILSNSATRFSRKPCIVVQKQQGGVHGGSSSRQEHVLTYESALQISKQHDRWIRTHVSSRDTIHSYVNDGGVVVVAYLAPNSPDMILSLLACMAVSDRHIRSKRSQYSARHRQSRHLLLPALLNSRWTPHEMAVALHSRQHHPNKQTQTVLIYDPCFHSVAQRAAEALVLLSAKNTTTTTAQQQPHSIRILALPLFAIGVIIARAARTGNGNANGNNLDNKHTNNRITVIDTNDTTVTAKGKGVDVDVDTWVDSTIYRIEQQHKSSSTCRNLNRDETDTNPAPTTPSRANVHQNDDDNDETVDDTAVIVFTSGTTTGGSKGVRLSHNSMYTQALAKLQNPCKYSSQTHMLATTVPLFHVGGLSSVLALFLAGGTWIFPVATPGPTTGPFAAQSERVVTPSFDPTSVVSSLSQPQQLLHQYSLPPSWRTVNTLVVVPAMLQSILEHIKYIDSKAEQTQTFDSVRLILIGGQSASPSLLQNLIRIFPRTRIVQTYACTEAASSLTFYQVYPRLLPQKEQHQNQMYALSHQNVLGNCVGLPPPHIQIGIFQRNKEQEGTSNTDIDSSKSPTTIHTESKLILLHEPYTVGIIGTRGPHVMNGYWNQSAGSHTNSNINTHKEWYLTSDLGFLDDRKRLYFTGRVHDVIRTGGETVVSSEVEQVLLRHGDISECVVFALPDEKFGKTVCAALVSNTINVPLDAHIENAAITTTSATPLTIAQVRQFCANENLAGYKRPRRIFHVMASELPRNSSGKLLKLRLVERFSRPKSKFRSKL